MITPTVGRIIWFYPTYNPSKTSEGEQPRPGIITYVDGDLISVTVFDRWGSVQGYTSIEIAKEGEEPPMRPYAAWMPYQLGQAKKQQEELTVGAEVNLEVPAGLAPLPPLPLSPPLPETLKDRLTIQDIEAVIKAERYIVLQETTTTICYLILVNGYVVTGESACVNPANFNEFKGREEARKRAVDKVWMLEGHLLKQKRYEAEQKQEDKKDDGFVPF